MSSAATIVQVPCNWRNAQHWLGGGEPSMEMLASAPVAPEAIEGFQIVLSPGRQREIVKDWPDGTLTLRNWFAEMEASCRSHGKSFRYQKFGHFNYRERTFNVERSYLGLAFRFSAEDYGPASAFKLAFYGY